MCGSYNLRKSIRRHVRLRNGLLPRVRMGRSEVAGLRVCRRPVDAQLARSTAQCGRSTRAAPWCSSLHGCARGNVGRLIWPAVMCTHGSSWAYGEERYGGNIPERAVWRNAGANFWMSKQQDYGCLVDPSWGGPARGGQLQPGQPEFEGNHTPNWGC